LVLESGEEMREVILIFGVVVVVVVVFAYIRRGGMI
jgi:hypothetical protein